MNHCLLKNSF